MLRRLYHDQPESFAFTPDNLKWAEGQISKYPDGRQASAVIPLLWRAQEQEGWLSRPAIEYVGELLGMAYIRVLEVATFYFMFQLQPVGSVAHIQVCGTTSCMICGAEDLIGICKEKIAPNPHQISDDGKLSWEEVECLGACANAPMAQIGKDYYEDLSAKNFSKILDELRAGTVPTPGSQIGRFAAEPASGVTSLTEYVEGRMAANASVALATELGDTVKRIDGSEVPILTPWLKGREAETIAKPVTVPGGQAADAGAPKPAAETTPKKSAAKADTKAADKKASDPKTAPKAAAKPAAPAATDAATAPTGPGTRPEALTAARDGGPDDLKKIKGVGPKLEALLHELGFFHFDQVAAWTADEVSWVDQNLKGFKGRATRDSWQDQARILAEGGETEFSKKVDKGNVY